MTKRKTKSKRAAKKKAKKVQKSIYWEPELVEQVADDAKKSRRSFSDQLAWIASAHYQEAAN